MERGSRDDDRQLAAGHHGRPPCSILGADAPSAPARARLVLSVLVLSVLVLSVLVLSVPAPVAMV